MKYLFDLENGPDEKSVSATLPSLGKVVLAKEKGSEDIVAVYEVDDEVIVGKYVYTGKPLVTITNFKVKKA